MLFCGSPKINSLDAQKLARLALSIGTEAVRITAKRHHRSSAATLASLRDAAIASALDIITVHNGRRGRGHGLEEVRAEAFREAVNAIRRLTDGRKVSTLAFGSGRTRADDTAERPDTFKRQPGGKRAGKNAGITAGENPAGDPITWGRAVLELAYQRLSREHQAALDKGAPDRHLTGKNATSAERQRQRYAEAQEAFRVAAEEASRDQPAIEALQAQDAAERRRQTRTVNMRPRALPGENIYGFRGWLPVERRNGSWLIEWSPNGWTRQRQRPGWARPFVLVSLLPA